MKEVNKVIAEWLGLKDQIIPMQYANGECIDVIENLDFLHDRNQQKWIIDELEKRNYWLIYTYSPSDKTWVIQIHKVINEGRTDFRLIQVRKKNQSKDQAFIDAVIELIEKEK